MKVDFKKTLDSYKAKRDKYSIIDVPTMQYLMVDGHNGPTSPTYASAIETLYPIAYTLKFMAKLDLDQDYVVPPLEALWWAQDMAAFTTKFDQSQWDWTAMIMVPPWITKTMYNTAVKQVIKKKSPPSIDLLRLDKLAEGKCVQTLHLGSYSEEGPVLKTMHEAFIPDNGLSMEGKHHEIYFNDFRKVAPEKLRTILRQPVSVNSK